MYHQNENIFSISFFTVRIDNIIINILVVLRIEMKESWIFFKRSKTVLKKVPPLIIMRGFQPFFAPWTFT
jgi:hypothetical protein